MERVDCPLSHLSVKSSQKMFVLFIVFEQFVRRLCPSIECKWIPRTEEAEISLSSIVSLTKIFIIDVLYISIFRFREESTFPTIQGSVEEAREARGGWARDRRGLRERCWRRYSLGAQTQTQT